MERILLKKNDNFFIKNNISIINCISDIPEKSCIIFVKKKIIYELFPAIKQKKYVYILILEKKDTLFDYKKCTIPNNIIKIYTNTYIDHPIIKYIPMGGEYNYKEPVTNLNTERDILCYCNFTLSTHNDRRKIYRRIKNKKFIKFEGMSEKFPVYSISKHIFLKDYPIQNL